MSEEFNLTIDKWHSSFNPKLFLSNVNLDKLIEKNEVSNSSKVQTGNTPCILCSSKLGPGLRLNDKSYLCKTCLLTVSTITFPQKYEKRRRNYLTEIESRRLAYLDLAQKFGYHSEDTPLTIFAWLSLFLLLIHIGFIVVPISLSLFSFYFKKEQIKKIEIWNRQKKEWEKNYPEPKKPSLKHFHEPNVQLSKDDYKILKVFNNWPGYPPFWDYLRKVVLRRDGNHCQVSGCPSRSDYLHIHHKIPVSQGGEHVPNNLVTLCEFHHALEPDIGHDGIWGKIKTRYFTIVRGHSRHNRSSEGYHKVRPHIRRLELTTFEELNKIKIFHSLSCPLCKSENIAISVNAYVNVHCNSCDQNWSGTKELTEETGPRLAELLNIKRNKGIWYSRWDMLSTRTDNAFTSMLSDSKVKSKNVKTNYKYKSNKPLCPLCDSPMKLLKPYPGQKWKEFWGCTQYRSEGCRGSREV